MKTLRNTVDLLKRLTKEGTDNPEEWKQLDEMMVNLDKARNCINICFAAYAKLAKERG